MSGGPEASGGGAGLRGGTGGGGVAGAGPSAAPAPAGARGTGSAAAIVAKDLRVELRGKEVVGAMVLLALFIVVAANLVFDVRGQEVRVAAAVLWITLLFALSLGVALTFTKEVDRGTLRTLLLAPVDVSSVYLAKAATNTVLGLLLVAFTVPLYALFFSYDLLPVLGGLLLVLGLGVVGLVAVGTLFAAVAARTKTREVLLPVLLFPLAVPLLLAALSATFPVLRGEGLLQAWNGVTFLVGYDVTMLALGWLLFEYVVET